MLFKDNVILCPHKEKTTEYTYIVVKSLSCIQLFRDLMDCGPPGFSVHGIGQTRILEWTAILSSTFNISESENLAEDEIFRSSKNL